MSEGMEFHLPMYFQSRSAESPIPSFPQIQQASYPPRADFSFPSTSSDIPGWTMIHIVVSGDSKKGRDKLAYSAIDLAESVAVVRGLQTQSRQLMLISW